MKFLNSIKPAERTAHIAPNFTAELIINYSGAQQKTTLAGGLDKLVFIGYNIDERQLPLRRLA